VPISFSKDLERTFREVVEDDLPAGRKPPQLIEDVAQALGSGRMPNKHFSLTSGGNILIKGTKDYKQHFPYLIKLCKEAGIASAYANGGDFLLAM
jgi:hypothetical protein